MAAPDLAEWRVRLALAARRLRRAPGFTVVSILLLGAGMSIAAAAFTLVNVALFKTPAGTEHLVHIAYPDYGNSLPQDAVDAVREAPPQSFALFGGFGFTRRTAVVAAGASHTAAVEAVAGAYFDLFDATPLTGAVFDGDNPADVAVISDRFSTRVYGNAPDIVGQEVVVAGRRLTIAGVVATPVRPGQGADVWVPAHVLPVSRLLGQLHDDATIDEASAEVSARYELLGSYGERRRMFVREGLSPPPGPEYVAQLLWLFSLAVVTSLTASASFGLLLFARLVGLQSQMAVRLALGATPRDLARLLTAEVLILAALSSVAALVGGHLLVRFVIAEFAASMGPVALDLAPDWRVFLAVGTLTLVVALVVVARLGWSIVRLEALGSAVATGGMGGATIRTAGASSRLIAAQSAATAALLLLAALIVRAALPDRTFMHGIEPDGTLIAWIDDTAYDEQPGESTRQLRQLQRVAEELGDSVAAAAVSSLPAGMSRSVWPRVTNGRLFGRVGARTHYVAADTFVALGLAPIRGRVFDALEDEASIPVAVVSRTAAAHLWPDLDPIGRQLWLNRSDGTSAELTVIGEVDDVENLESWSDTGDVYVPIGHRSGGSLGLLVHVDPSRGSITPEALRSSLQQAFPDVGLLSVRTLEQELRDRSTPPTFIPRILGTLGVLVFIIAMSGLYGLMSYLAAMRRREVGIRRALGATGVTLCRMLTREVSGTLCAGLALGLIFAVTVGMLFVTEHTPFRPFDPVAIMTVIPTLYVAGLLAAIVPFLPAIRTRTLELQKG